MTLDFRLNRVFSAPLAKLLLATPLTPNQVTVLSLLSGISAGWLFSLGHYGTSLCGAGLYILAALLDNCDGEIARTKKLGSVFGAWFDIIGDFFTDISLFIGIALSQFGKNNDASVTLFLGLCLSGATLHCALVMLEKKQGFGPAVYGMANPEHFSRWRFLKIFDALREGDACWLVFLFALAGKTHTLLWFGGIYMQILWMVAFAMSYKYIFIKK